MSPHDIVATPPKLDPYSPAPEHATDGNFAVPRPAQSLAFTGERMTTEREGQVEFEHFHRYCIARDLCAGRDVLDVASGEGYGSALLADVARSVTGVEIDIEAVAHARAGYERPNLRFLQGDAQQLPLADASFDVVVSFETLEHLRHQNVFLREVKRVLRPNGLLIVSTPDRHVYSAPGQPVNRYHVLELSPPEFATRLAEFFGNARILQQRAMLGSVIAPLDSGGAWRTYDRRAADIIEAAPGLSRAFYLIGIASDGPIPSVGSSLYGDNRSIDDMIGAAAALPQVRDAEAALAASLAAARSDFARARDALESANSALTTAQNRLEKELDALRCDQQRTHRALDDAELEQQRLQDALVRLQSSTWWRAGRPLRAFGQRFPWLIRALRPALRLAYACATGRIFTRQRSPMGPQEQGAGPETLESPGDLRAELGLPPHRDPVPPASSIRLPCYDAMPVVSVIIPTFGQVTHTLRCLASIAATPPRVPIEVLVVEDASRDPRIAELRDVAGLRLIVREENLGFLKSCNDAARQAEGEFLFLLNNDTEVMPGAIDSLYDLLRARPDAGLAGARLLYPDGSLQEAGGIIWRDGSAWNYGNREDPRKPDYNYVREADYISGAAIMLPRSVWDRLGGFDEHFLPAYCEDSDLAFRVRQTGLLTLYQPDATVIHFEGVTHGTDIGTGIKAYQATNMEKLELRWQDTLRGAHFHNGTRIMRARDRSLGRTVTLVIDHYVPEPDRDAGSRSMLAFMEALQSSGRIVKFLPENLHPTQGYTRALQQRGIEVIYDPWAGSIAKWLAANGGEIDEVLVSRPHIAEACIDLLRTHTRAPIAFYGHDLHHLRMRREPGADTDAEKRDAADAAEALERRVWRAVDVVLYPSEEEVAAVRALEPGVNAQVLQPYALPPLPPRDTVSPPEGGLIFVAGFAHPPNVDAAIWLVRDILPRVRATHPGVTLAMVGSNPTQEVQDLSGDGVEVTGYITDDELARRYGAARVAVCPLRFGAGVKMKVVEAMHQGLPLVTTPSGAEGLPGLDKVVGVHADPGAFAAAVVALLDDDALWIARSAAQRSYVAERFSLEGVRCGLDAAFASARVMPL
jgi:GT2 family glycosyltransferase/2-polyprenyl-3-methyl-5-hydroxy-6-metoxy-1,4-benzoquinol methylase/glycosyltransferase involved in cell wall biosynthesis